MSYVGLFVVLLWGSVLLWPLFWLLIDSLMQEAVIKSLLCASPWGGGIHGEKNKRTSMRSGTWPHALLLTLLAPQPAQFPSQLSAGVQFRSDSPCSYSAHVMLQVPGRCCLGVLPSAAGLAVWGMFSPGV